ncbi:hypothetical protein Pmar_PMAR011771 [Perkinsus marinus ATCC 50983]|uniref:Uncharacterized protein n=1 Tax=Perkinsus marinus (strain ATCC 50983 / TXsc) TaxID=423536 RepID=C5LCP0_PERM5|nr:hypothetical protein Pmar_PMAR011771 [Perkinsus marinus ATCC 50983]EER05723.1 hypothetical protein Pmar_PMAR011771 [Perkinsus marinus ATCC 50983]|eukprot:XP_002773907.1 hypothetical protein Pmar_PMAR011771 [Perkinsus marinus ATCC 50983]
MMRETVDVGGDSVLANKVSKRRAAISANILIDDFILQLQTRLGVGFNDFLTYVSTSDPNTAIMASIFEPVGELPVVSTHEVRHILDDIFIAYLMTTLDVTEPLYTALLEVHRFGLPLPDTLVKAVQEYQRTV